MDKEKVFAAEQVVIKAWVMGLTERLMSQRMWRFSCWSGADSFIVDSVIEYSGHSGIPDRDCRGETTL